MSVSRTFGRECTFTGGKFDELVKSIVFGNDSAQNWIFPGVDFSILITLHEVDVNKYRDN